MTEMLIDPREYRDRPVLAGLEAVQACIPQRHEMGLLHGILALDREAGLVVGFHDTRPTDFWVRGHLPGRPLMPGVVMVEAAAQLCAWMAHDLIPNPPGKFFGFAGIDEVRFRGQVEPGERLLLAARIVRVRKPLAVFGAQAFVRDEMVFEGRITGMTM